MKTKVRKTAEAEGENENGRQINKEKSAFLSLLLFSQRNWFFLSFHIVMGQNAGIWNICEYFLIDNNFIFKKKTCYDTTVFQYYVSPRNSKFHKCPFGYFGPSLISHINIAHYFRWKKFGFWWTIELLQLFVFFLLVFRLSFANWFFEEEGKNTYKMIFVASKYVWNRMKLINDNN